MRHSTHPLRVKANAVPAFESYIGLEMIMRSIALVIALTGNTLLNYLFGIIANRYSISSLPILLLACIICMLVLLILIKQTITSKLKI